MESEKAHGKQAGSAIWFNKREVARIDLTVEHVLSPQNDGWRIEFRASGSIRLEMAKGAKESIGVSMGDSLLSSGEDFYLTLSRADAERKERKERSAAKRAAREAGNAGRQIPRRSASMPNEAAR